MRLEDDRIMKILYSPAHYTHLSHLPASLHDREMWGDVLLNYWIIENCQLENVDESWTPTGTAASLILSHWQLMPNVAHLIGGYLLRSKLMFRSAELMTDSRLRAFISLPLFHHVQIDTNEQNFDTSAWGLAFIFSLAAGLPQAFRQRLLLGFDKNITLPELDTESTPHHINLLRMAISYAHNYQQ